MFSRPTVHSVALWFVSVLVGVECAALLFILTNSEEVSFQTTTQIITTDAVNTVEPQTQPALDTTEISILFAGDTMFERFYERPDRDLFARLASTSPGFFTEPDIVTLNLEGVIAPPASPVKLYDFAFGDYYAQLLATYGVDAVSLANNHSLDQGTAGYNRTVELLTEVGVGTYGHQTKFVAPVYATTAEGRSIAFVGFNLTHPGADKDLARQIIASSTALYDFTIVSVHWGPEYQLLPSSQQKTWGRLFVDAGADAVIGAHPHVMQGMEVYEDAPILWSLGNFVFDQDFSVETRQGLAAVLTLRATSTEIKPIPITIEQYAPYYATSTAAARLQAFVTRSTLDDSLISSSTDSLLITIPSENWPAYSD